MAEVEYSSRAVEWIEEAEPDAREQVRKKLEQAADFPEHFLRRLTNSPYYRLRAGTTGRWSTGGATRTRKSCSSAKSAIVTGFTTDWGCCGYSQRSIDRWVRAKAHTDGRFRHGGN